MSLYYSVVCAEFIPRECSMLLNVQLFCGKSSVHCNIIRYLLGLLNSRESVVSGNNITKLLKMF